MPRAREVILKNTQAPGDIMMMSAAVRDLHRCYPGQFITHVESTAPAIWENNPYVQAVNKKNAETFRLGYPLIHRSNQCGLHFIQGFIDDMNRKMKLKVRLTEFRPDLHWSAVEKQERLVDGDYWVIVSGGKADFTTKWWDPSRFQQVVNALQDTVNFVQLGGKPQGGGARHYHPPLAGAVNLVGKTKLRDAMRIMLHARGVVTPVTMFMHMAAAIGIPAVVIAGGREAATWEAYTTDNLMRNMAFASGLINKLPGTKAERGRWTPEADQAYVDHPFVPHDYFHSIGTLPCSKHGGCWKTKVIEGRPDQNCTNVVQKAGRVPLPKCLDMITPEQVIEAVMKHEESRKSGTEETSVSKLVVNLNGANEPPPDQGKNPILGKQQRTTASPKPHKPNIARNKQRNNPSQLEFKHLKFPITICGLSYGDHTRLALRCLKSIYANLDPKLFKLRWAMNEPSDEMKKAVTEYLKQKNNVVKVYESSPQIYKYPMMRRMFHDPDHPLDTDWVMWFDDDSHVTDSNWIQTIGAEVDKKFLAQDDKYPKGYHMFGKVYYFHLRGNQWDWIKQAKWYTGRKFNVDYTKRPPMDKSDFCTGGFWLVTKEAIMAADWPDPRIKHRGGDIMMGVALQQQGYGVAQAYKGVKISDAKQRGYNEDIAGIK